MIRENENVPDDERLELWEFNLDVEDQKRLDAMVEQEVTLVMHTHPNVNPRNLQFCFEVMMVVILNTVTL